MSEIDFSNLNQTTLAGAIGFHTRTINRWVKSGLPKNKNGNFDLREVVKWLLVRAEQDNGTAGSEEAQRWLTAFRKSRALISELERRKLEGMLIEKSKVEDAFGGRAYELRRNLELMSRRIGTNLAAACQCKIGEITRLLDAEMYFMLGVYTRQMTIDGINIENAYHAEVKAILDSLRKNKNQTEVEKVMEDFEIPNN